MFKHSGFKKDFGKPRPKNFGFHIYLTFKELGFKVGPSYFVVKIVCFQLRIKTQVLSIAKPPSWIGVENNRFNQ